MKSSSNFILLSLYRSLQPATEHISRITNRYAPTSVASFSSSVRALSHGKENQRMGTTRSPSRGVKSSSCPYAATSQPLTLPLEEEAPLRKSMHELPGPIGWPVVGNFLMYLRLKNIGKMHLVQARLHKKYGKIFREKWGPNWQVHVSDPKLMEEIHRQEGRYPNRPTMRSWTLYRDVNSLPHGITTAQGSEWQLYRTEFGKKVFCPFGVKSLVAPINQVSDDLVLKLKKIYKEQGPSEIAHSIPNVAYLWSLEAAGSFLFETRLGCLSEEIPTRTQLFLNSLFEMMSSSLYIIVGEKFHQKYNTSFWKRFAGGWENILKIGKDLINDKVEALGKNEANSGLYLSHFINNPNLTKEQVHTNIAELLMAASDTTANTLCFALYLLAKNPDKQDKLRTEIHTILRPSSSTTSSLSSSSSSSSSSSKLPVNVSQEDLPKLKYLRTVVKETMRMFPIVTMNCRILDNDIVLDGYSIPKNTLLLMNQYSSSMDPDYFSQPEKFMPERWNRNQNSTYEEMFSDDVDAKTDGKFEEQSSTAGQSKRHPFACIPFGFGTRSCLGKHVGNMELMVSIAKIVDSFDLKAIEGEEIKTRLRTLLNPGKRVPITLVPRK